MYMTLSWILEVAEHARWEQLDVNRARREELRGALRQVGEQELEEAQARLDALPEEARQRVLDWLRPQPAPGAPWEASPHTHVTAGRARRLDLSRGFIQYLRGATSYSDWLDTSPESPSGKPDKPSMSNSKPGSSARQAESAKRVFLLSAFPVGSEDELEAARKPSQKAILETIGKAPDESWVHQVAVLGSSFETILERWLLEHSECIEDASAKREFIRRGAKVSLLHGSGKDNRISAEALGRSIAAVSGLDQAFCIAVVRLAILDAVASRLLLFNRVFVPDHAPAYFCIEGARPAMRELSSTSPERTETRQARSKT